MKTKKEDVLNFLATGDTSGAQQFNQAFEMFRHSDNRNTTQERHLNKTGYSETTLNTLLYELQKLHGITENEIRKAKKVVVLVSKDNSLIVQGFLNLSEALQTSILQFVKLNDEFVIAIDSVGSDNLDKFKECQGKDFQEFFTEETLATMTDDEEKYFLSKSKEVAYPEYLIEDIVELSKPVPSENLNNIDVANVQTITPETLEVKLTQSFSTAPDEVKNEIKFRDEFPFISDPDLPAELKQLVTEKFNHYYAFADAHVALSNGLYADGEKVVSLSNDQVFELAKKAVENFQMDQLIREEFVYYKEYKKVLGTHPIFKQRKLQDTVNSMTTAELARRAPLLENYIRRDKAKSEAAKTDQDKVKFADKVEDWQFELALVNVKLGISVTK